MCSVVWQQGSVLYLFRTVGFVFSNVVCVLYCGTRSLVGHTRMFSSVVCVFSCVVGACVFSSEAY